MEFTTQENYSLLLYIIRFGIVLVGAALTGWCAFRTFSANRGEGCHRGRTLVPEIGKGLSRRVAILYPALSLLIVLAIGVFADTAGAWNRAIPSEYGRVIIKNYSKRAGLAPVVFDHWVHRSRFTCRLCHVDIGFAMNAGETDITAVMNRQGLYCGTCHDGKRPVGDKKIFAACSEGVSKEESSRCDRCHSLGKNVKKEHDFTAFAEKLPKTVLGNGIDWELAEEKGLITPVDFLEGVSRKRTPLQAQKDFSIQEKPRGWRRCFFRIRSTQSGTDARSATRRSFPT